MSVLAGFKEVRFPTDISYGCTGGPGFLTDVNPQQNGQEQRNQEWEFENVYFDASKGLRNQADLDTVLAFFRVMRGKAWGFRWKNQADWKSCSATATRAFNDQILVNTVTGLAQGDGTTATFQMFKRYTVSGNTYDKPIVKPVSGTVKAGFNGVEKTITTQWTVDTTTGIVTFTGGNIPPNGQLTTWGAEYDEPVRFDTDRMMVNLSDYNYSVWGQIPVVGLKLYTG